MSDHRRGMLTEEEARALWERALELQHEAARRQEGTAVAEEDRAQGLMGPGGGFRLEEVTAAAREAGISQPYMEMALAEQEVTRKREGWRRGRGGAAARRMLSPRTSAIEVSRTIRREPAAVLAAMQRVLPANPYGLILEDTRGDDPLDGGTLIFKVPSMQAYSTGATFSWDMAWGPVTHLLVSLFPVPASGQRAGQGPGQGSEPGTGQGSAQGRGAPGATEVVIRAPLVEHERQSYWLGLGMVGTLGLAGGFAGLLSGVGMAAGAAALGPLGIVAAVAAPTALGMGGGGGLGVWGTRGVYRSGIRKSRESLESLLQVLDANSRTGGGFHLPRGNGGGGSSDTDLTFLLSS
jgi:eukaryotic-like serine/threonine-protein kinase